MSLQIKIDFRKYMLFFIESKTGTKSLTTQPTGMFKMNQLLYEILELD